MTDPTTIDAHPTREPETGTSGTPAGLTWNEAVAHGRLVALSMTHRAYEGLKRIADGRPLEPVPPYLADHLRWTRSPKTGALGAFMRRATESEPPMSDDGDPDWLWTRHASYVRERAMHRHVDGVEHRRTAWQAWEPDRPKLAPDEARILIAPLAREDAQQRAVAVDARAGLHLDGTLRGGTARVFWTAHGESGVYPDAGSAGDRTGWAELEAVQAGLAEAVQWLASLYRLEDLRPIRQP